MTASPNLLTALLDQVDAAARHVQAGMHAQATRTGQPLRNIAADPWVRRVAAELAVWALLNEPAGPIVLEGPLMA